MVTDIKETDGAVSPGSLCQDERHKKRHCSGHTQRHKFRNKLCPGWNILCSDKDNAGIRAKENDSVTHIGVYFRSSYLHFIMRLIAAQFTIKENLEHSGGEEVKDVP